MKGYPKWFSKWFVICIFGLLFFSGLLLVPTVFENHLQIDMPWRISSSGRIGTAAIHALAAFCALFLLGALWSIHMRVEWRKGEKRASSIMMLGFLFVLTLTGLGVYYIGEPNFSLVASVLHACIGLLFCVPFLIHVAMKKKAKKDFDF